MHGNVRHDDKDVLRWAGHYLEPKVSFQGLENWLGVSHSTICWCFHHRLQGIDKETYKKVMKKVKEENKRERN